MRRPLGLLLAFAVAGCAPRAGGGRPEARVERVAVGGAEFRLVYFEEDAGAASELREILAEATLRTRRWGELRTAVTLTIHPTHEALERAVHREGYRWLRAWARYDSVDVQSPRTWSWLGPGRDELLELLVHELTHCVMYQNAATGDSWADKEIPLWFREGLASVTAGQGHRRVGPEVIARFYAVAPRGPSSGGGAGGDGAGGAEGVRERGDPLADPEPLYRSQAELVYGTAHVAFEFLLVRYGDERVRRLLAYMRGGDTYAGAFGKAIGIEAEAFERDFRRYLVWQGWGG